MDRRDDTCEEVVQAQRKTKKDAPSEGIGTPAPGLEPPTHSYLDEAGVADLGVNEPVVPADLDSDDDPSQGSNPTGMFAGETLADRREEDAVRQVLEAEFLTTRGHWKAGGQMPSRTNDSEPQIPTWGATNVNPFVRNGRDGDAGRSRPDIWVAARIRPLC